MTTLQFAAQSYQARSLPLDAQRCVNMFVERSPSDAKTAVPIYMSPGLDVWSRLGAGPIWGMHAGPFDNLYVVSGYQLFLVNRDGLAILIGDTTLGGLVSMANNEGQLVMVDGDVGWVYQAGGLNQITVAPGVAGDTSITVASIGSFVGGDPIVISMDDGTSFATQITGTSGVPSNLIISLAQPLPSTLSTGALAIDSNNVLGQITAPAFVPASTVVYFDDYFIFDARGTNDFFLSGLGDATQFNGLDFASAQADPDFVLAVVNYHEQLLIFGEKTIEVWYDAGAANFPFQRFDGAFIQRGLASPQATVKEDNTVFWLGEDGVFYRLNGYQPVRISTFATEHAWAQYPIITDASCFVVTIEGHKFIFLTFPAGNATWCYDISTGTEQPLWHERESWGSAWV